MNWFTMDSAPKDGKEVLVTDGKRVEKAWFGFDHNDFDEVEGGWWYGTGDDFSVGYYYNPIDPVKWMPIPDLNEEPIKK